MDGSLALNLSSENPEDLFLHLPRVIQMTADGSSGIADSGWAGVFRIWIRFRSADGIPLRDMRGRSAPIVRREICCAGPVNGRRCCNGHGRPLSNRLKGD